MDDPDYVDVLKALALGRTAEADALMWQHGAATAADDVYRRNLLSAVFVIVLEQRLVAIPARLDGPCRPARSAT